MVGEAMSDTGHEEIIDHICEKYGARRTKFRKELKKAMNEHGDGLDGDYLDSRYPGNYPVPDAFVMAPAAYNDSVMMITVFEVECTHPIPGRNLDRYTQLWFDLDCTDGLDLQLYIVNRFGDENKVCLVRSYYDALGGQGPSQSIPAGDNGGPVGLATIHRQQGLDGTR